MILTFSACKKSLQNQLADKIEKDCGTNPGPKCRIVLSEVTQFKWDKVYLFGSWTEADSISRNIGFKYNGDGTYDDTQHLVFTNGKQIVYQEDIDYLNGDKKILFDDSADSLFQTKRSYTRSEAIFSAVRNHDADFGKYSLSKTQ